MSIIYNLQILRAFAAINVAILHLIATASAYGFEPKYLSILSGWGNNGVDVFFVLSGFIILHSQLQKKRSFGDFLRFRIIRIVPIYWFVTIALISCYLIFPSTAFNSKIPSLEHILQSLFFLSSLNNNVSVPVVGVGWTLEFEMLFYFIFGLSLIFMKWNKSYLFIFLCLIILTIVTSNFILIEFLFGMLIAIAFNNYKIQNKHALIVATVGFLLLLLSINRSDDIIAFRVAVWGIPSAMIIFGLVYAKQYDNNFLRYLGDASYSIYLIHAFIISAFYKVITISSISINYDLLAIIGLFMSVSCGALMYSYIEKPMTSLIKSKFS